MDDFPEFKMSKAEMKMINDEDMIGKKKGGESPFEALKPIISGISRYDKIKKRTDKRDQESYVRIVSKSQQYAKTARDDLVRMSQKK